MDIQRVEEVNIEAFEKKHIEALFKKCFEVYPEGRIYYNQLADFRFLAWEKPNLIGHLGVSFRVISSESKPYHVFGIVDLCVDQAHWKRQVASRLIKACEMFAREREIHFLVLTTNTDSLYTKNGFKHVENSCRWVMINNNQTFGVVERNIGEGFMVKQLTDVPWPKGVIDLMGPMF